MKMNFSKNKLKQTLVFVLIASALGLLAFVSKPVTPQSEEIKWYDFQEGYEKAMKDKKILFVDSYTDWCGYCKLMDRNTFSDPQIINILNTHFIPVKFNPEKDGKYLVNNKVLSGWELQYFLGSGKHYGFPSFFVWENPESSNQVKLHVGYQKPKPFLKVLNNYLPDDKKVAEETEN
jgi:thioredoxin-related protein